MDAVEDLLDRQGGMARRRDLLAAGLTRRRLRRRVELGQLRALTPHLFTDRSEPAPDEALRSAAVGLQAVVSHTSAALLWGLELAATPDALTVTVDRDRSRVSRAGVTVRRADLSAGDQVERDGLRVTTVLQTVLDLCRSLPLAHAVAAADSALRRRLLTVEDLQQALCALPAGRGRSTVAEVLGLVDPLCGSVLESLARVLLALAGLRPPQSQLPVYAAGDLLIGRVDFAWDGARLVVQTDGFASTPTAGATGRTGAGATHWSWRAGGCSGSRGRTWLRTRTTSWRVYERPCRSPRPGPPCTHRDPLCVAAALARPWAGARTITMCADGSGSAGPGRLRPGGVAVGYGPSGVRPGDGGRRRSRP